MFKKSAGPLCCFMAALFWGITFSAQDKAAETMEAFTFLTGRSVLGTLALLSVVLVLTAVKKKRGTYQPASKKEKKYLLLGGLASAVLLCSASVLQQMGIARNVGSPGKDAFITALYIIFVPVLGLFFKEKAPAHVYLCIGVAAGGLWLLCMSGSALTVGDIQLLICSFLFACQVVLVGKVAPHVDGIQLSCVQFAFVSLFSAVFMLIFEAPQLAGIWAGFPYLLFAGIFSSGGAYTLQIIGQQRTSTVLACLLLSLESVFGVLAGMILQNLYPAPREWMGMCLIFIAIVAAQIEIPAKKKRDTPQET